MVTFRLGLTVLLLAVIAPCLRAGKPDKAVAVIAGTVFREPGFALAGAEIELQPDPEPGASNKRKLKTMKTQSDGRGEFSFRVPATPMRYTLRVRSSGFTEENKSIAIQDEQRQDVFITLKAASKETVQ